MATELYPSSFRCDCGEELHFSESTIVNRSSILLTLSRQKEKNYGQSTHKLWRLGAKSSVYVVFQYFSNDI